MGSFVPLGLYGFTLDYFHLLGIAKISQTFFNKIPRIQRIAEKTSYVSAFLSLCLSALVNLWKFIILVHISSLEFVWKPPGSCVTQGELPFCLSVFPSFCPGWLSILVHLGTLEFVWRPSEPCVLTFRLFVFLFFLFSPFCHSLTLIFHFSPSIVHWNSPGSLLSPCLLSFRIVVFLSFYLSSS